MPANAHGSLSECCATDLFMAIEALAQAPSLDEVVEILRKTARQLVGADGITVILRDGESCHYVEEDAVGPLWKGHRFPMRSCISGIAMIERRTIVIPDIAEDPRVPIEAYRNTFVRSMFMVPVRSRDPIGAIGAYWSEKRWASPAEIVVLERLARGAAAAIDNARLVAALTKARDEAELARDELRHRVKNAFLSAQSVAMLTLPPAQASTFISRIAALARAQELLDHELAQRHSIELGELVSVEMEPYRADASHRLQMRSGDLIFLTSSQAKSLGLAINELAINSLKHGALSNDGTLDISWKVDDDRAVVDWREETILDDRLDIAEGLGTRLLRRLIEGQLRGSVQRRFSSSGFACRIEFGIAAPAT